VYLAIPQMEIAILPSGIEPELQALSACPDH
jgi:hypothetical protein